MVESDLCGHDVCCFVDYFAVFLSTDEVELIDHDKAEQYINESSESRRAGIQIVGISLEGT